MKRFILSLLLIFLFSGILIGCDFSRISDDLEYEIVQFSNEILSSEFSELTIGKESNKVKEINLVNSSSEIVATLFLPKALIGQFYDIRYENDDLYFIQSVAIDDESGIIFSEDTFINMNGLFRVERIGGHTYSFATYR